MFENRGQVWCGRGVEMGPMPGPMPFRRYVSWFLLCGGAVVSFLTCNTLFFISIKSHESKLRELKQRLLKTEVRTYYYFNCTLFI